jgi:hypothetical protein
MQHGSAENFLPQRSKVFITEDAENAENTEGLQRPITPTKPGFDRRAPSARQEINRGRRASRHTTDTSVFSVSL